MRSPLLIATTTCFLRRLHLLGIGLALATSASAQTLQFASGTTVASITAARDAYRSDLGGGTVTGANGSFGGLRREINWDAVAANFSAPNNLPADFFNSTSPRGVIFSTSGTGFQLSGASTDAGAGQPAQANFGNNNPQYTSTFAPFSQQRLFTALGSVITDISFFLPGTTTPATTRGFGAVFSDVDLTGSTSIEFFDASSNSLDKEFVPATSGDATFSFLGVSFSSPVIARVRITSGNALLSSTAFDENGNGNTDLVVMDDFIYAEPVLEPATLSLLVAGAGFAIGVLKGRAARLA